MRETYLITEDGNERLEKLKSDLVALWFNSSNKNFAIVSKTIQPNNFGEIKYKGTFYKAQSKNSIDEGKKVKVVSKGDEQGSFFIVEEIIN